ncbi:hypothetical protein F4808DRAFT_96948 [Astrocystis sublimbata]|nr:hypothetical protein F4808DRAFT_96948 [Astrocystis sublimbata]
MVSFFGLKIGGEKKKKSSKDVEVPPPKIRALDDPQATDSNFFDFEGGPNATYEASVYSLSRQTSNQSSLSKKSKFKAPFASMKFGSSMTDLPTPPTLGRRLGTGSATSLKLAPPNFSILARPNTSDVKSQPFIDPLDVHFNRDSSNPGPKGPLSPLSPLSPTSTGRDDVQPSTPLSAAPRSPLGQYELKLDLPEDVSSFADFGDFGETIKTPAPLRIKKPASIRLAARTPAESLSPQKPPSPPQSIVDRETPETSTPITARPLAADMQSISVPSRHEVSSGVDESELPRSNFGPASLPSPSTTPRVSEEKSSRTASSLSHTSPSSKKNSIKPVIQNVTAKRDTLTISAQRRYSLQMKIEAENGNVPLHPLADRSKTSNHARPPPLTLNTNTGFRLNVVDRNGPRSAPFLPNPRSITPISIKSPLRSRIDVQELDSPGGSSVYDEDNAYDYPPSPESTSPVIPLTGPLASPRFPPPSQSPGSFASSFSFPRKEETDIDCSPSPTTPPIPPRSAMRRNAPMPDYSCWPLPSPVVPSFDRAAMTPSPAGSRICSESGSEALSIYEPLEPPRLPTARPGAESPTFRSFSRPWTPTAFGGGLRPPPRSVNAKQMGLENNDVNRPSAPVGGNGSGNEFI